MSELCCGCGVCSLGICVWCRVCRALGPGFRHCVLLQLVFFPADNGVLLSEGENRYGLQTTRVPHNVASCAFSQCAPRIAYFALVIPVALPVQCVFMREAVPSYDVFGARACGVTYLTLPVSSIVGFVVSFLYCGWCCVVCVGERGGGGSCLCGSCVAVDKSSVLSSVPAHAFNRSCLVHCCFLLGCTSSTSCESLCVSLWSWLQSEAVIVLMMCTRML